MADCAWSDLINYAAMEDLQSLPLDYDDYIIDMPPTDTPSLPPSSDMKQPPATSKQATQSSESGISCTNNGCSCGLRFRRRSDLKKHVDQRTRPYRCLQPGCPTRPFSTKHDRDRHQREVHGSSAGSSRGSSVVKLHCPVATCKRHVRGFARKENLALHVRNMHPGEAQTQTQTQTQAMAREQREVMGQAVEPWRWTSSLSASPVAAASLPLSPAGTQGTGSSGRASSVVDSLLLLTGLTEHLTTLRARRELMARQLAGMDARIEAVARTVLGLQGGGDLDLDMHGSENWAWMVGDERVGSRAWI